VSNSLQRTNNTSFLVRSFSSLSFFSHFPQGTRVSLRFESFPFHYISLIARSSKFNYPYSPPLAGSIVFPSRFTNTKVLQILRTGLQMLFPRVRGGSPFLVNLPSLDPTPPSLDCLAQHGFGPAFFDGDPQPRYSLEGKGPYQGRFYAIFPSARVFPHILSSLFSGFFLPRTPPQCTPTFGVHTFFQQHSSFPPCPPCLDPAAGPSFLILKPPSYMMIRFFPSTSRWSQSSPIPPPGEAP